MLFLSHFYWCAEEWKAVGPAFHSLLWKKMFQHVTLCVIYYVYTTSALCIVWMKRCCETTKGMRNQCQETSKWRHLRLFYYVLCLLLWRQKCDIIILFVLKIAIYSRNAQKSLVFVALLFYFLFCSVLSQCAVRLSTLVFILMKEKSSITTVF